MTFESPLSSFGAPRIRPAFRTGRTSPLTWIRPATSGGAPGTGASRTDCNFGNLRQRNPIMSGADTNDHDPFFGRILTMQNGTGQKLGARAIDPVAPLGGVEGSFFKRLLNAQKTLPRFCPIQPGAGAHRLSDELRERGPTRSRCIRASSHSSPVVMPSPCGTGSSPRLPSRI